MIHKVVVASLFISALIALFFTLAGIQDQDLSKPFLAFINSTSRELEQFKVAIPNIPQIPKIPPANTGEWYEFAVTALNAIVGFLNGLVNLINFIIMALNYVIQLLEFIVLLIKNIVIMRDGLLAQ